MLDVSCIIINYNSSNYTIACIKSIIKHTKPELTFEIIVVDNASKKEDYLHLEQEFKQFISSKTTLIKSVINTGFGGGNMFGTQFTNPSKYLAFINNDCEIESDVLSQLKSRMDSNTSIGVCSPQMLDSDKEFVPTISAFPSAIKEIFGRRILEKIFRKKYPKKRQKYTVPVKTDLVIGSFMFFNTNDFCTIGGFDTNLFLYYEEADICYRLKKIGKSTFLFPSLTYIHHISKSTGSNKNPKIQIEHHTSLLYILRKNNGLLSYIIILNFLRIKYAIKSVFNSSKFSLFMALLKGVPLTQSLKQEQKII